MPVFTTADGRTVPSVTADEMREVDRVAVEGVELGLLQMMENAGRTLAGVVRDRLPDGEVVVLAGPGGNGGGGLCAARHLHNRGGTVRVLLDRDPGEVSGAAGRQYRILAKSDVVLTAAGDSTGADLRQRLADADVLVDALLGYGLVGAPRGTVADLLTAVEAVDTPVVSLDVPSGLDATTGETPGVGVSADATLTLALPKTGLATGDDAPSLRPAVGDLLLADIGIPPVVYRRAGVGVGESLTDYRPVGDADWVRLVGVHR